MKSLICFLLGTLFISSQAMSQCGDHKNSHVVQVSHHETGDLVDVAVSSKDHTTLVAAVKAAGLVETLKSKGPFTVFAPTNDAFNKLPDGTVETLLKPENKDQLVKILTYHVLSGRYEAKDVISGIMKGGGKLTVETVSGGKLIASLKNDKVILTDENGNKSIVTTTDLRGSNGVIHVIDTVVLPK